MKNDSIQAATPPHAQPVPLNASEHPLRRFPWETRARDRQHLKVLAIFMYLGAAFFAALAVFLLLYIPIGVAFLSPGTTAPPLAPPAFGWILISIGVVIPTMYFGHALLMFLAGEGLRKYKRWRIIFAAAVLMFLYAPVGTLLGVFTIVVLNRDSVRTLFEHGEPEHPLMDDA